MRKDSLNSKTWLGVIIFAVSCGSGKDQEPTNTEAAIQHDVASTIEFELAGIPYGYDPNYGQPFGNWFVRQPLGGAQFYRQPARVVYGQAPMGAFDAYGHWGPVNPYRAMGAQQVNQGAYWPAVVQQPIQRQYDQQMAWQAYAYPRAPQPLYAPRPMFYQQRGFAPVAMQVPAAPALRPMFPARSPQQGYAPVAMQVPAAPARLPVQYQPARPLPPRVVIAEAQQPQVAHGVVRIGPRVGPVIPPGFTPGVVPVAARVPLQPGKPSGVAPAEVGGLAAAPEVPKSPKRVVPVAAPDDSNEPNLRGNWHGGRKTIPTYTPTTEYLSQLTPENQALTRQRFLGMNQALSGFDRVDVAGDGNCALYAVLYQQGWRRRQSEEVEAPIKALVDNYRDQIAQGVRQGIISTSVLAAVTELPVSSTPEAQIREAFVSQFVAGSKDLDDVTLSILARVNRFKIVVHDTNTGLSKTLGDESLPDASMPVYHLLRVGNHFQALVPKQPQH